MKILLVTLSYLISISAFAGIPFGKEDIVTEESSNSVSEMIIEGSLVFDQFTVPGRIFTEIQTNDGKIYSVYGGYFSGMKECNDGEFLISSEEVIGESDFGNIGGEKLGYRVLDFNCRDENK